MKSLLALLALTFSITSQGAEVLNPETGQYINTQKVAHLVGEVDDDLATNFYIEMLSTRKLPGSRVVIIDTPGGSTESGDRIIELMEAEKKAGVAQICVVTGMAASMGFNILSHCDIRLATLTSHLLFHNISIYLPANMYPLNVLRAIAAKFKADQAKYDDLNRKLLGMDKAEYARHCDAETFWNAPQLVEMHYLHGIALIK